MPATFTVPDHIRQILRDATVYIPDKPSPANMHTLKLNGQLARKDYQDVMKVIEGAGGKWDRKRGLHTFRDDPSHLLMLAAEEGKGRNIQQEFQAFYTPAPLAAKMAALLPAGVERVLEPSCGEGALLRAVRKLHPTAFLVGYDINPEALRKCGLGGKGNGMGGPPPKCELEPGYSVLKDYLETTSASCGTFDAIIANPPFTKGQDAKHVLHAMALHLQVGGTLVALMTPNALQKETGEYRVWRAEISNLLKWRLTHQEVIPAKTFKDTDIETLLIRIERLE
jgi:tRNA1(Val) A37 N6-methylase TrmN6